MTESAMKVLVVDDEAPARRQLIRYLSSDDRFQVVGQAADGPDAVLQIQELKPDLLLLDIQMPAMSGFDVLRIVEPPYPAVIFATAYDQYAVQAFEVSAVDYLLKPISESRLKIALDRAVEGQGGDVKNLLDRLQQPGYITRLAVRHLKRVKLLQVEDIAYINSQHRVVHVFDKQQNRYWTNETLDQLMRRLDPEFFFRIHRSSVINLSADFELEPWDDGRLKVHFPGVTLTVARDPATRLRKRLQF
jgi:DNA-binding LytR/AlgR family response regulator|tara:strand:+ start:17092 stop:17832 length:741 start_codon:yes stop_codon:yes gene_type:complete